MAALTPTPVPGGGAVQRVADLGVWLLFRLSGVRS